MVNCVENATIPAQGQCMKGVGTARPHKLFLNVRKWGRAVPTPPNLRLHELALRARTHARLRPELCRGRMLNGEADKVGQASRLSQMG